MSVSENEVTLGTFFVGMSRKVMWKVPNFAEWEIWTFMIVGGIGNYPGIMIARPIKRYENISSIVDQINN